MAKREHRKKRQRSAHHAHAEPRVYVPVVHGIGARSATDWSDTSVEAMAAWWLNSCRDVAASTLDCPGDTDCDLAAGHLHLRLVRGRRAALVDLDPIYWASRVEPPNRWRAAWLTLKVGLVVGLVDFLAAARAALGAFRGALESDDGGWLTVRSLMASGWRAFRLAIRAIATPFLALLAPLLVIMCSKVRRSVSDALAWSADPAARSRVSEHVEQHIAQRRGDGPVVMVGHSQGASILAAIEPRLRRSRNDTRLVTLGSGHALLAAVEKVIPTWSLWRSGLLWLGVFFWAALVGLAFLTFAFSGWEIVLDTVAGSVRAGAALWVAEMSPDLATSIANNGNLEMMTGVVERLEESESPATAFLGAVTGMVGLALFLLVQTLVGRDRAEQVSRAVNTGAQGIDIVATHDLVSSALLELGDADRRRPVRQCASVVRDHTNYFRNGCSVLPLIAQEVEVAGRLGRIRAQDLSPGIAHHASGLRQRRATHLGAALVTALFVGAVVFGEHMYSPISLLVMACIACALLAALSSRNRKWLCRASTASQRTPWRVRALDSVHRRRKNPGWTAWLAFTALPLLGGGALMLRLPVGSPELASLDAVAADAGYLCLIGTSLAIVAWFSYFGSRRADLFAAFSSGLASVLWLQQHNGLGAFMACVMVATGIWGVSRFIRHRVAPTSVEQPV